MKILDEINESLKDHEVNLTYKNFCKDSSLDIKIVVPFSGGKDSQCCLKLVLQDYKPNKVLALFCDTSFEHPITYRHVNVVAEKYGVCLVALNAGSVEDVCLRYKRLPGGGSRHCTDYLKIRPSKFFYKYLSNYFDFQVWLGMRSDESKEREKRYKGKLDGTLYAPNDVLKKYPKYLYKNGVTFRLPILDWATDEVFKLLDGEENPLYAKGFDRVGCFPCLAGGERLQVKAFEFDETGKKKHFKLATSIANKIGRPLLSTKKYENYSGCAICAI